MKNLLYLIPLLPLFLSIPVAASSDGMQINLPGVVKIPTMINGTAPEPNNCPVGKVGCVLIAGMMY